VHGGLIDVDTTHASPGFNQSEIFWWDITELSCRPDYRQDYPTLSDYFSVLRNSSGNMTSNKARPPRRDGPAVNSIATRTFCGHQNYRLGEIDAISEPESNLFS
jgi:hypothetical protein